MFIHKPIAPLDLRSYSLQSEILRATKQQGKMLIPYHIYTWKENIEPIKNDPSVVAIFEDVIDEGFDRHLFPCMCRSC